MTDHRGVMLLLPADVLRPRRPDEHFAGEARAAREAGIEVALIDHDALSLPFNLPGFVDVTQVDHEGSPCVIMVLAKDP
ncbi:hypothetical protein AB0I88_40170, partial [Actinoplanes sp. NPDC049802]